MSQHWIEGYLYSSKKRKEMRQDKTTIFVIPVVFLVPFLGVCLIFAHSAVPMVFRILGTVILTASVPLLFLLFYRFGKAALAEYRQRDATYSCGEYAVVLQLGEECRTLPWYRGAIVSRIKAIEGPLGYGGGYDTKYFHWDSYFALWAIGGKPPVPEGYVVRIVKDFSGIILPDTPEVRQYLQERLGLKEIPEYPRTAIYSPIQSDPQWVEE